MQRADDVDNEFIQVQLIDHIINPDVLRRYRADKQRHIRPPLEHEQLAEESNTQPPDWTGLVNAAVQLPSGHQEADAFHKAIEQLLAALFYPSLTNPQSEFPIHEGRKRIDGELTAWARRSLVRARFQSESECVEIGLWGGYIVKVNQLIAY